MTRTVNSQSTLFWEFNIAEIWCTSRLLVVTITYESREFLCDPSETFISNRSRLQNVLLVSNTLYNSSDSFINSSANRIYFLLCNAASGNPFAMHRTNSLHSTQFLGAVFTHIYIKLYSINGVEIKLLARDSYPSYRGFEDIAFIIQLHAIATGGVLFPTQRFRYVIDLHR